MIRSFKVKKGYIDLSHNQEEGKAEPTVYYTEETLYTDGKVILAPIDYKTLQEHHLMKEEQERQERARKEPSWPLK